MIHLIVALIKKTLHSKINYFIEPALSKNEKKLN